MLKRFTLLFVFALLSAAAHSPVAAQQQPVQPAEPKEAAFRLKGLDGKFYDTAEMRGDVLVVSFGATWCTPCVWELVAIAELKEEYAGKPVKFFWVSIEDEKQTSNNLLRHFVKEQQVKIPVLRDPKLEAFSQFSTGVRIPVVVFFGPDGRYIAPAHRGMASEIADYKKMVRKRVDSLLKAREDAPGAAATATK
ncbi:MAG TPA: TlpA disulfide reductase family protein [Pyrinomonadaceae bacterium]|jgi:thiol-disulfide isomerase/thioredoxin|nr:TlpA disulfide reductase family protein [Pyrinomonadaceae bacterium]